MIDFFKKHKILTYITLSLIIFNIIIAVLAVVPANKDIIAPGGLNTVESVINVENDTKINGSFHTIYVYSMERVSVLQALIAMLSPNNTVDDSSDIINLSTADNRLSGIIQKNQSIEASLICAYEAAEDANLNYNFEGLIVYMHQINHDVFKVGDIITKINDSANKEELRDAYLDLKIGDKIIYKKRITDDVFVDSEYIVDKDFTENYMDFYCYYKFKIIEEGSYPSFNLYESTTSGPSGGLMQTLSIYSQITGIDLTFGHKIAGTGTISVSGNVGNIGGIKQKIITAIHNDVDVFLCPTDNYSEALEVYNKTPGHEKMKLVEVFTFTQAVNELVNIYGNN